jgi:putative transferase (TIGR04331 family)
LKYINDQVDYLNILPKKIKKIVKLRLYNKDYNCCFKEQFIDKGYKSNIDNIKNLNKSFYARLSECRLCIATYNATTYLETFSMNYPTLLYWSPIYWELNNSSKSYFKLLEDAGILHYTAKSLVQKLEEIYKDPMKWWQQEEIQKAKDVFCDRFANRINYFIDDYKREIDNLINE